MCLSLPSQRPQAGRERPKTAVPAPAGILMAGRVGKGNLGALERSYLGQPRRARGLAVYQVARFVAFRMGRRFNIRV
jgi:hypothetical protein